MSTETIQPIDVHGHYGRYDRGTDALTNGFMSGDERVVVERARRAHIRLTIVAPLLALLPRGRGDAALGNLDAARVVAATPGLAQYVVIDPRVSESYRQAEAMLATPTCVGIKIHPE